MKCSINQWSYERNYNSLFAVSGKAFLAERCHIHVQSRYNDGVTILTMVYFLLSLFLTKEAKSLSFAFVSRRGRDLGYFLGWVCAARDSKFWARFKKELALILLPRSRDRSISLNHARQLTMCNTGCNSLFFNSLNRIFKGNLTSNNFRWLLIKLELSCVQNILSPDTGNVSKMDTPFTNTTFTTPLGDTFPYRYCIGVPQGFVAQWEVSVSTSYSQPVNATCNADGFSPVSIHLSRRKCSRVFVFNNSVCRPARDWGLTFKTHAHNTKNTGYWQLQ